MGVVRLMDMMAEREVVRNEALLLMIVLTHSNADIQKIAAFEGAFDRLFKIIKCALQAARGIPAGTIVRLGFPPDVSVLSSWPEGKCGHGEAAGGVAGRREAQTAGSWCRTACSCCRACCGGTAATSACSGGTAAAHSNRSRRLL